MRPANPVIALLWFLSAGPYIGNGPLLAAAAPAPAPVPQGDYGRERHQQNGGGSQP